MICNRQMLLLPLLLLATACSSQQQPVDRQPAVAGMFYPDNRVELTQMLDGFFAKAIGPQERGPVLALIVPHAGYVFSGEVAASGYNQLDPDRAYDNVFVVGSSHHMRYDGASVYCSGDFITPLGRVTVNRELGEDLARRHDVFSTRVDAHIPEHSIEVQLPFLQEHLKRPFRIVPILLGTDSPETCRAIASALRPYLTEENLFVISSDFSHYPSYEAAQRVDSVTAAAITSNQPDVFLKTLQANDASGIAHLVTSLCGWTSVLTLLDMTSSEKDVVYHTIQYRNSGDASLGGRDRVVGYCAIVALHAEDPAQSSLELSKTDQTTLLRIARRAVETIVTEHTIAPIDDAPLTSALRARRGAFVTLTEHEMLRGCIGRFDASDPLYQVVQAMAIASATEDPRFEPVSPGELRDLVIEISVLSPLRRIASADELQLGKHGIYIRKGARSGTFLPQVAAETGWTKEEFLGHCAQDKAGIGWDGWRDAELFVYEALVFDEKGRSSTP